MPPNQRNIMKPPRRLSLFTYLLSHTLFSQFEFRTPSYKHNANLPPPDSFKASVAYNISNNPSFKLSASYFHHFSFGPPSPFHHTCRSPPRPFAPSSSPS